MNRELAKKILAGIPKLSTKSVKGENGRIGVIGGSFQFTGAPFYSAMSALKVGVDMAHIFCAKSAALPIKAYSPESIVHPVFTLSDDIDHEASKEQLEKMHNNWLDKIGAWRNAITGWVIGPGLGRDRHLDSFFPRLIQSFEDNTLLVFDADGLFYLCQHPYLFKTLGRFRVILTPNHKELKYLKNHLKIEIGQNQSKPGEIVTQVNNIDFHEDFKMLVKGEFDYFLTKEKCYGIWVPGGSKRCGGVGDLVAGATVACGGWDFEYGPILASMVIRTATKAAYEEEGRSLTAPSIIKHIGKSFVQIEQMLKQVVGEQPKL